MTMMEKEERERAARAYEAARALLPRLKLSPDKKAWFYESLVRHYGHTMAKAEFDAARAEVRALVRNLRVTERLEEETGYWQSQSDRILERHLAPFKPFFETRERRELLREAIEEERARLATTTPMMMMQPGSDRFFKGLILRTLYTMLDTVFDICYMGKVDASPGYAQETRFHGFMLRARQPVAEDDEARRPAKRPRRRATMREEEEMADAAF